MAVKELRPTSSIVVESNSAPPPPTGGKLPVPVEFPGIKIIDKSENGEWWRIRHDGDGNLNTCPRIPGANNNEINVPRPWKADFSDIDPRSKITILVGQSQPLRFFSSILTIALDLEEPLAIKWENYCKSMSTEWAWKRITAKGYWCFDRGYPKMDQLWIGGNDLHVLEITPKGWARVEHQSYSAGPDYNIHPYTHRWLFSKQWLVGGQIGDPHWVVDKGYEGGIGDVNLPIASDEAMFTSTWVPKDDSRPGQQSLERWPDLPLKGKYDGVDCTVTQYGLWKTDTYGWLEAPGEVSGWRILEEMVPSGDPNDYAVGGTWKDRVVHFTPWIGTHPPSYIGWVRPG